MAWPITKHYKDTYWAFCAFISTGVVVFCVPDRYRGDTEICRRAEGQMAGRGMTSMYALGSCQQFNDECYPDLASAKLRWPDIREANIPDMQ